MIIYGSKTKQIKSEDIKHKCLNCGAQHHITLTLFQKYAHVFWIPIFPVGKTALSECAHCRQVLEQREFPAALNEEFKQLKQTTKTPAWAFSGLFLLVILLILAGFNSKKIGEKNADLIAAPDKGDIYEIKKGSQQYTLYKVLKISGDTIYMLTHDYETNKATGLADLKNKGDSAYSGEALPLLKTELKNMLDKGEIIDVER